MDDRHRSDKEEVENDTQQEIQATIVTIANLCQKSSAEIKPFETPLNFTLEKLLELQSANKPDGNIISVDNRFKHAVENKIYQKNSTVFDVSEYHPNISSIKITKINNAPALSGTSVMISIKTKEKTEHYLVPPAMFFTPVVSEINKLQAILPEKNIEVISKKQFRTTVKPRSKEFWAKAETNWDEQAENKNYYVNVSDPAIKETFHEHVLPLAKKGKALTIIDAGGGKGRVAEQLIEMAMNADPPVKLNYILVEPDAYQYSVAQKVLDNLKQKYKDLLTFQVIKDTVENFANSTASRQLKKKTDVVLSSGGPLNQEIVSYEDAQKNLSSLQKFLKPDGLLIATGLSAVSFTKKDFLQHGFNVLGTVKEKKHPGYSRKNMPIEKNFIQMYVCQNLPKDTFANRAKQFVGKLFKSDSHREATQNNNNPSIKKHNR